MTTFVALYRGQTISDARLIGVSAEPQLVHTVANALLNEESKVDDPVLGSMNNGRKNALRLITNDTSPTEKGGA